MKIALITGASGGIGIETVKTFTENGYYVIAMYNKNRASLDKLILDFGLEEKVYLVSCDLSDEKALNQVISDLAKSFKHVDVLVNNAGVDYYGLITDTTDNDWKRVMDVNVNSAFKLSKWALESMISKKSGKIINVSSVWGISGASMEVAYSTSKSALIGFTKALAKEVAPSNVTVNCVCPGVIDTPMNDIFSDTEKQEIINDIPLARFGKACEVAQLIYYLASSNGDYVTGQTITIDGGYIL